MPRRCTQQVRAKMPFIFNLSIAHHENTLHDGVDVLVMPHYNVSYIYIGKLDYSSYLNGLSL